MIHNYPIQMGDPHVTMGFNANPWSNGTIHWALDHQGREHQDAATWQFRDAAPKTGHLWTMGFLNARIQGICWYMMIYADIYADISATFAFDQC